MEGVGGIAVGGGLASGTRAGSRLATRSGRRPDWTGKPGWWSLRPQLRAGMLSGGCGHLLIQDNKNSLQLSFMHLSNVDKMSDGVNVWAN